MSEKSQDYDVLLGIEGISTLSFNVKTKKFAWDNISNEEVVKFLKGHFRNRTEFMDKMNRWKMIPNPQYSMVDIVPAVEEFMHQVQEAEDECRATMAEMTKELEKLTPGTDEYKKMEQDIYDERPYMDRFDESRHEFECEDAIDNLIELYDQVEPFTYREAFELGEKDTGFQALVWGTIDVVDMIKNMGHKRVATAGKPVKHKQYDQDGNFTGHEEYDVIYETHKVEGKDIGVEDEDLYALRCWCTSTDEEHWLWIEQEYKDDPLEAVASTFRIHENLIPHVKEIKRQGDILMVEMNKDDIEPEGEIVTLNADQYFSLLTAQS